MKIAIIIPVLNPTDKLIDLTNELIKNKFDNIIIVDDGSTDEHKKIYNKISNNIKVIYHDKNLGKGCALKTGIKSLNNIDAFITVDADGQHKVSDVIKIREALKKYDIVFGTRNLNSSNIPIRSKIGNKFSSLFYRLITKKRCKDTQTGLRGINIKYKDLCLETKGNRYEYEMNFLLDISKKDIDIYYVDIETIYEDNNSHFNVIKDSFLIYKKYIFKFLLEVIIILIVILIIRLG